MIRRPPRSTQGVSSAASDVYKRQLENWTTVMLAFIITFQTSYIMSNSRDQNKQVEKIMALPKVIKSLRTTALRNAGHIKQCPCNIDDSSHNPIKHFYENVWI
eukprot:TRINITY_DN25958_c0_g1_i1.p4 TRINITY_DN25958_c0_g1~~TRINITY_DN25958_c0_g1_i1.p4  ORF type:complete len:103 (-),score=12.97 TRINITY_DN25958_c0_g1_i1:231-539(-)